MISAYSAVESHTMTTPLSDDAVMIRWIDMREVNEHILDRLTVLLSPEERARASRLRLASDALAYRAAHILKRCALSAAGGARAPAPADWNFVESRFGKPAIATRTGEGPPLHFNVSHTGGLVAVAIMRRSEIGVDVERITRFDDDVAAAVFTEFERGQIEALPENERMRAAFTLWVLKEASLKALGTGLATPPSALEFTLCPPMLHSSQLRGAPPVAWHIFCRYPTPEHVLAAAIHAPETHFTIDARAWKLIG